MRSEWENRVRRCRSSRESRKVRRWLSRSEEEDSREKLNLRWMRRLPSVPRGVKEGEWKTSMTMPSAAKVRAMKCWRPSMLRGSGCERVAVKVDDMMIVIKGMSIGFDFNFFFKRRKMKKKLK